MEEIFTGNNTARKFTGFVLPSIIMMIILSLYYSIDVILVSNYAGDKALATMSLVYPVIGIVWGVSIMFAAGSSAIVAMKLGAGRCKEANDDFTQILVISIATSILMIIIFKLFENKIIGFLGAEGELIVLCKEYLDILVWCNPAAFVGVIFEYYIRVDGRPQITLYLYLLSGAIHIGSAWMLMGRFSLGIAGAAYGSFAGNSIAAIGGYIVFISPKTKLKLSRFHFNGKYIWRSAINGSGEFVTQTSYGIMTFAFNAIMLDIVGTNGVAALSVVLSVHYCLISMHIGYSIGIVPLISFYYGAACYEKVKTILAYTRRFLIASAVLLTMICWVFAPQIVSIFNIHSYAVYTMAVHGLKIMSPVFVLTGFTIFASNFFIAYGCGQISAIISLARSLVLVIGFGLLLSYLFGIDGLWSSLFVAEAVTSILAIYFIEKYKNKYKYNLKTIG